MSRRPSFYTIFQQRSSAAHSLVSSISQQKRREGGVDEVVVGMRFPLHFIESAGIAIDENREPAVLGEAKKMVAAVFSSAFNCTNIPQRKMMMKRDLAQVSYSRAVTDILQTI